MCGFAGIFGLLLLLITFSAESAVAFTIGDRSLGIGGNRNGLLLEVTLYDHPNWRHGMYVGLGGWVWNEEGQPLDGYFPWVDYGKKDWSAAYSLHGGYALRATKQVSLGVGLGLSYRDFYLHGTSPVTGLEWKIDAPDESEVGPHGWLEVGESRGKAVRIQYGPARIGASLQFRY